MNHLIRVTNPRGSVITATYDRNGNRLSLTDPRGDVTQYTYDAMDRLTERRDLLGRVEQFTFNAGGTTNRLVDRKARATALGYDRLKWSLRVSFADGSRGVEFRLPSFDAEPPRRRFVTRIHADSVLRSQSLAVVARAGSSFLATTDVRLPLCPLRVPTRAVLVARRAS